jgi:hypothetical protein
MSRGPVKLTLSASLFIIERTVAIATYLLIPRDHLAKGLHFIAYLQRDRGCQRTHKFWHAHDGPGSCRILQITIVTWVWTAMVAILRRADDWLCDDFVAINFLQCPGLAAQSLPAVSTKVKVQRMMQTAHHPKAKGRICFLEAEHPSGCLLKSHLARPRDVGTRLGVSRKSSPSPLNKMHASSVRIGDMDHYLLAPQVPKYRQTRHSFKFQLAHSRKTDRSAFDPILFADQDYF